MNKQVALDTADAQAMNEPEVVERTKSKLPRLLLLISVPLLLALVGGYFWLTSGRYVSTDNAYVQQDKLSVSADVNGPIAAVYVHENQRVKKGELLFKIDPSRYEVALEQANAQIAQAQVQVQTLQTQVSGTGADIQGAASNVTFTQRAFDRQAELMKRGFTTRARYDEALHAVQEAKERLANARAEAANKRAELATGGETNQPAIQAAYAARDRALLDLKRTEVRAPADGVVTQTDRLQIANAVVTGVPVVTIVRSAAAWVEANYKETDLANMFVGQPAKLEFDAYPDLEVRGRVESIGAGTGSEFSVLPAQNATGNWVKVTQRVPVRIAIEGNPSRPMIAGLSVKVIVDTQSRTGQQTAARR